MALALRMMQIMFYFKWLFCHLDDNYAWFRTLRRSLGFIRLKGQYRAECFGKDGKLKWKAIANNGVTTAGLNHILNVQFGATAKSASWFLGLIDLTTFTALAAGDTMAAHGGWIESVIYSQATRPAYTVVAAAAGSITNAAAVAVFSMNAGGTVKGFFANDVNTKGGTTGNLWATALFATGDQVVVNGDIINVTYVITAT